MKIRVKYFHLDEVKDAGECELLSYEDERLKLRNGRIFYLPMYSLTEETKEQLEKLVETKS